MTAAVQSVLIFDIFILSFIAFLTRLYLSRRCQKPAGSTEHPVEEIDCPSAPWYIWALKSFDRDAEAKRGFTKKENEPKVDYDRSWADTPSDILCEIYSRLLAGERAMFRSTCRSWNSSVVGTSTQHQFQLPLYNEPCLLFFNNRIFHPIYDRFSHMDFLCIPFLKVYMAKDGWLLVKQRPHDLLFWNPFTEEKVILPVIDSGAIESAYFSSPPTTPDWFVVLAVFSIRESFGIGIYTIKCGDDSWTSFKISQKRENSFNFSANSPVVYKGLYYLLGDDGKLLIYNPKSQMFHIHEAPECISQLIKCCFDLEKYMLEAGDGCILAVFVGHEGTSVITLQWNISEEKWETVESLGDKMVFVSNIRSLCVKATTIGTGNKIYFPRFVDTSSQSHGLFYSLSTKKLHTFEVGVTSSATSHQSFIGSKFHPHTTWWML